MKKFAVKVASLLLILWLVDKPMGYMISKYVKAKQADNRIELLMENKINQELLVIGSSRAVNDIDPALIQKETGISSYNLGYSGSNLLFHEQILSLITKKGSPKQILLTVDGAPTFQKNERGIFRKDKLEPFLCYNEVLSVYSAFTDKNYYACRISWTFRENQNFFPALEYLKSGKDEGDETSAVNEYGAIFLTGTHGKIKNVPEEKRIVPYQPELENDSLVNSFLNIVSICQENDIDLTVVIPPNYQNRCPGFNTRLNELVNGRCDILDFSKNLQEKELFFDKGHLNKAGAIKFTSLIIDSFKK